VSEIEGVDAAIETVEEGRITDYQLRKPRGEQAAEPEQEDES